MVTNINSCVCHEGLCTEHPFSFKFPQIVPQDEKKELFYIEVFPRLSQKYS